MRGKLAGKGQMQAVRQSRESKMWPPRACMCAVMKVMWRLNGDN